MEFVIARKVMPSGSTIEKRFSLPVWDLMRNKDEKGDTRKGWTLVSGAHVKAMAPMGKSSSPAFTPEEIVEGPPAPKVNQSAPEVPAATVEVPAEPLAEVPHTSATSDNFMVITGFSPKAIAAVGSLGITTYAQLASGDGEAIKAALVAQGIGPKAAMIPLWKSKAAELARQ